MKPAEYDCQHCGLCCRSTLAIWLTEQDYKKFIADPKLAGFIDTQNGWVLKQSHCGHWCSALRGGKGRYSCAIYGKRPLVCIEFPPGCDKCLELRIGAGLPY